MLELQILQAGNIGMFHMDISEELRGYLVPSGYDFLEKIGIENSMENFSLKTDFSIEHA